MRLYHMPNSSSQRVLWLLEEVGEPYELTIVGDRASRQQDPEYMARHPMGRVPVLEDDQGTHVFESAAICLHVADSYPDAGLIAPVGTPERALVYQWSFFAMTEIQASAMRVRLLREPDPQAAETARRSLLEALAAVEQALEGHEYLVGDRFTVADLLIAAALNVVRRFDAAEVPARLISYVDGMDTRPAKRRAEAR